MSSVCFKKKIPSVAFDTVINMIPNDVYSMIKSDIIPMSSEFNETRK